MKIKLVDFVGLTPVQVLWDGMCDTYCVKWFDHSSGLFIPRTREMVMG